MTALSDSTIRQRFSTLIEGGALDRAGACHYYCVPGKVFPSGIDANGDALKAVDWSQIPAEDWPGETAYLVHPGALVTLRTREKVNMPSDYCGLWNQTDPLSKQGLLLVNTSVVSPGYQGPLTCTFVNFGKTVIPIKPNTFVAKLLFLGLDKAADKQSKYDTREYDGKLADMARESPTTFLQISERAKELNDLIADAQAKFAAEGEQIEKKIADGVAAAIEQFETDMQRQFKVAGDKFSDDAKAAEDHFRETTTADAKSAVWKAAPLAALAIALLGAGQWIATSVLTTNVEKQAKERADEIEKKINVQLEAIGGKPVFVYSGSPEMKALQERISVLEAERNKAQDKKK